MTHFLPEASIFRRKASSGVRSKSGSTQRLLACGRLMILSAWTSSPSSVTGTSSRSRKLRAPIASSLPISPPLAALRVIALAQISDAFDPQPPIEQHRGRLGQGIEDRAIKIQEGQKSRGHL